MHPPARPLPSAPKGVLPPWIAEGRAMLILAWPLILANLTMAIIHATDVWLIGRLGSHALAAGALGVNLAMVFSIFCLGLVTASAPMMASALGARANAVRDVRRSFRQTLWVALCALIPAWVILWHAEPLIRALGQQADLARDAALFLRGQMWSLAPFTLFQVMRNFASALERPAWVLIVSLIGVVLNALLGWALIFGHFGLPALGLLGGGIATSLVWTIMAGTLVMVIRLHPRFRRFHLFGHFWRADWGRFHQVWRLGLPIAITLGFEGSVFSAAAYLMGMISPAALAAHTVALQICMLTFMMPMGVAQAATVRVGLGLGRRDPVAIARSGWTAYLLGVGFMALMAMLIWAVPGRLMGLFMKPEAANAEVIGLGIGYLVIAAAFQIVDGAQVIGAGVLRGLHDTRVPMIFAAIGYWGFGLGGGALLAFHFQLEGRGVWLGLALGLAIVAILMLSRWLLRARFGLVGGKVGQA